MALKSSAMLNRTAVSYVRTCPLVYMSPRLAEHISTYQHELQNWI
jgi:hypothetical protein